MKAEPKLNLTGYLLCAPKYKTTGRLLVVSNAQDTCSKVGTPVGAIGGGSYIHQ